MYNSILGAGGSDHAGAEMAGAGAVAWTARGLRWVFVHLLSVFGPGDRSLHFGWYHMSGC